MMTKQEHIDYWIKTADDNWEDAQILFGLKRYSLALFMGHLLLEKLAKGLWVKHNEENFPPKIHNIVKILKGTKISFSEEQGLFFQKMNDFQLEGRYPDYRDMVYKLLDAETTQDYITKINEQRTWLLKMLQ